MKETEICFTDEAYASIVMHALKHSYDDTCGILLGKHVELEGEKGETETKQNKCRCTVMSVIPLFHTHMLSPSVDLIFTLAEDYCQGREEQIVGYYHISVDDSKNADVKNILMCELISDKLISNYKNGVICLAQLSKLKEMNGNCFNAFIKVNQSEWKKVKSEVSSQNFNFLKKNIPKNNHLNILDFDDHLNSINCDFMNPQLFKEN